jgi:nucleoside-diphosphate-sugar epimerase
MTATPRHVIFGTGAIGLALLDALRRRGETARLVNRSGHARVPDDVEVIGGDARDPAFTATVAEGAQVIYQILNPPYAEWTAQFPLLQAGVLAAAEATGARLVSMENVYMYGRPAGRVLTEDRAYEAHTRKGQLRARMAQDLLTAHDAGRVEVAIGRASDYFGPRGGAQSNLGDRVFPAALAGRTATVLGDPDQPHTYTYIPDIGEGLAVLGEHLDAPGQVWHLPTTPTPAAPGSWSTSSTGRPAKREANSAASRRCCCVPSAWSTPRFANSSRCSTSSRNRSSPTAARSPTSSASRPPRSSRPWPTRCGSTAMADTDIVWPVGTTDPDRPTH